MAIRTLTLGAIGILFGACAVTPRPSTSVAHSPTFDFTPPAAAKPGEAGVTIALLHPQYPETAIWAGTAPTFAQDMHADLVEILTARGFKVRGPFRTYDEMVYSEKQGSDVILMPTVEVSEGGQLDVKSEYKFRLIGASGNVYKWCDPLRIGQIRPRVVGAL